MFREKTRIPSKDIPVKQGSKRKEFGRRLGKSFNKELSSVTQCLKVTKK